MTDTRHVDLAIEMVKKLRERGHDIVLDGGIVGFRFAPATGECKHPLGGIDMRQYAPLFERPVIGLFVFAMALRELDGGSGRRL